jgi:hypothetical protein
MSLISLKRIDGSKFPKSKIYNGFIKTFDSNKKIMYNFRAGYNLPCYFI